MTLYEQLWADYQNNTTKGRLSDREGYYDILDHSEIKDKGFVVSLRSLDRYCGYDFEYVYGKSHVFVFQQEVLLHDLYQRACAQKVLGTLMDRLWVDWREELEWDSTVSVSECLDYDTFKEEMEDTDSVPSFLEHFGCQRLGGSALWYDIDYVQPIYEDPNQFKLDFSPTYDTEELNGLTS